MMRTLRWSTLALACLVTTACREHNEPVKPIAKSPLVLFIDY
jgi:hypothetical protein